MSKEIFKSLLKLAEGLVNCLPASHPHCKASAEITEQNKTIETNEYSWHGIYGELITKMARGSEFKWAQVKYHSNWWNSAVIPEGI